MRNNAIRFFLVNPEKTPLSDEAPLGWDGALPNAGEPPHMSRYCYFVRFADAEAAYHRYAYRREHVDPSLPKLTLRKIEPITQYVQSSISPKKPSLREKLGYSGCLDKSSTNLKSAVLDMIEHDGVVPYFGMSRKGVDSRAIIENLAPLSRHSGQTTVIHPSDMGDGDSNLRLILMAMRGTHIRTEYDLRKVIPEHFYIEAGQA